MPSRMSSVTGGVTSVPARTMYRFEPPPSDPWPPEQLDDDGRQLVRVSGQLDAHDAARPGHPLEVLAQPEDVQLPVGRVPVPADSFEHAGAVLQRVRRDAYPSVGEGHERAVEIG